MPIQKLTLQITVMCDTDTLQEAKDAYSGMTLAQIDHSINFGDDIGSTKLLSSETLLSNMQVIEELKAIGNDGTFFDCALNLSDLDHE